MASRIESLLSADDARRLLEYDPETGAFRWRVSPAKHIKAGSAAGSKHDGYIRIVIDRVNYRAHRVAWLMTTGAWPREEIDHINRIPDDNRLSNLREATRTENNANRSPTSTWKQRTPRERKVGLVGHEALGLGVARHRDRWQASISIRGRQVHLGLYDSNEEASRIYAAAAKVSAAYEGQWRP